MTRGDPYSHASAVLPVADVARSRRFYHEGLGFSVAFEWQDPPTYVVLKAGDSVSVHLSLTDAAGDPDGHRLVFGQGVSGSS